MSSDDRVSAYVRALRHPEIAEYRRQRRFRTDNTREDYVTTLAVIKSSLRERYGIRNLTDVNESMLGEYFNILREGEKRIVNGEEITISEPKSSPTFNKYVSIARDYFYHHLRRKYPHPQDKHYEHEQVDDEPDTYSEKERAKIIRAVEKDDNAILWKPVIGLLMFGARENDVCYLYEEHINKIDNLVYITKTEHHTPKRWKPKKKIVIPVNDKLIQWVDGWIEHKKQIAEKETFPLDEKDKPLLFIDNRLRKSGGRGKGEKSLKKVKRWGKSLADYEVRRKFKDFLDKANIQRRKTVHMLRSSYVVSQLDRGKKPHEILVATGHASTRSLDPYVRTSNYEEAAKKLPRDMI